MNAELSHHLGYERHAAEGRGSGNNRNGKSRKKVQGEFGSVEIEVPRDRNRTYDPKSIYARGMTTRDIQGHLEEAYGVEMSPTLISEVTDAVLEEVRSWQSRPLEPIYPILKMRHEWRVENRAVFVGIGVTLERSKEVLGL